MGFDNDAHFVFGECMRIAENPTRKYLTGCICRECGNELTAAYHEDRLYSVHCWKCGFVALLHADGWKQAAEIVSKK